VDCLSLSFNSSDFRR